MKSTYTFEMSRLWFSLLLVCSIHQVYGEPEGMIQQCLIEVGITQEDLPSKYEEIGDDPPENLLCFSKCVAEKSNTLRSDGTLNIKQIENNFPPFLAQSKDTAISCMEKIDKISSCQDMKKVKECLPKMPLSMN